MKITTIDFETFRIEPRGVGEYPPKPVSVAITNPGEPPRFMSWGHPVENNCTFDDARDVLLKIYRGDTKLLFHNAAFDLDVAAVHMGLPVPPWQRIHDTLLLCFLANPHSESLGLKQSAAYYLGMAPDEQDTLKLWILDHIYFSEKSCGGTVHISSDGKKPKGYFKCPPSRTAEWVAYAPGGLVGEYAIGDVVRTRALFDRLSHDIVDRGMGQAYNRDRKLLPILLANSTRGVSVDASALHQARDQCKHNMTAADSWLRTTLDAPDLNIDKASDLADALDAAGKVGEWVLTDKGNRSTSKDNLPKAISDSAIVNVLAYRAKVVNSMRNFVTPWLTMAENDGRIYTSWSQVRQEGSGKKSKGARTGRLSSSPNFQNATNEATRLTHVGSTPGDNDLILPLALFNVVTQLPNIREFITPSTNDRSVVGVDWAGQELRILAHFENGAMLQAYIDDPGLDFHGLAQAELSAMMGLDVQRKHVKALAFCIIYGGGIGLLAKMLKVTQDEAENFQRAYFTLLPGLKELIDGIKRIGRSGEAIRTWGGREYFVEPSKIINGRSRTFEYKMPNVLIQGSAGDVMKQALINYDQATGEGTGYGGRFLLALHDEIISDIPGATVPDATREISLLCDCMRDIELDVSLPVDAAWSNKSWHDMVELGEGF